MINGTSESLWPDCLESHSIPSHCSIVEQDQSQEDPLCPGADWYNLVGALDSQVNEDHIDDAVTDGLVFYYAIPSSGSQYLYTEGGSCPTDQNNLQICGEIGPVMVASAAFNNTFDWVQQGEVSSYLDIYHSIDENFYSAQTVIKCISDTIKDPNDPTPLNFPLLAKTEDEYHNQTKTFSAPNVTKADIYASPGRSSDFRLKRIRLPEELTGSPAASAVLLSPQNPTINPLQNITLCIISARWGTPAIITSLKDANVYSSLIELPTSYKPFLNDNTISPIGYGAVTFRGPVYTNVSGFAYPQRPIRVAPDWLAYLSPISTLDDKTNRTVINSYMSIFPPGATVLRVAQVLTYMLHGGLAFSGLNLPWQGKSVHQACGMPLTFKDLPDGPVQRTDCHVFQVNHSYYG